MIFDFDRFIVSAKLAYRRCPNPVYTLEEVLQVFRYYFDTYEYIFGKAHPIISLKQIAGIINKMPYVLDDSIHKEQADIDPVCYEAIIDQHFNTQYNCGNCDYNINHFFSGKIRDMRYYETCY